MSRAHVWSVVTVVMGVLLSSGSASAFELKQAANGQTVHWGGPTMTFVVDPSIEAAVPGGAAAVASAMAGWSGQSGAPNLVLKAGPGGGKAAVDGVNTVLLAPDGFAPAGAALAVTVLTYDEQTGEILDADIVVNGVYAFAVLAANAQSPGAAPMPLEGATSITAGAGTFDLFHVVAHETGHALGLGDVGDDDAVMYAYTTPGDAAYRAPASDDQAGIEAIYGATSRAGCSSASIAGSPAGAAGSWWAAVLLLGSLSVWAARRRPASAVSLSAPRPRR
jgi:Matrixin